MCADLRIHNCVSFVSLYPCGSRCNCCCCCCWCFFPIVFPLYIPCDLLNSLPHAHSCALRIIFVALFPSTTFPVFSHIPAWHSYSQSISSCLLVVVLSCAFINFFLLHFGSYAFCCCVPLVLLLIWCLLLLFFLHFVKFHLRLLFVVFCLLFFLACFKKFVIVRWKSCNSRLWEKILISCVHTLRRNWN